MLFIIGDLVNLRKSNLKSITIFEKVQKNLTFSGCVVDLKMILESEDE